MSLINSKLNLENQSVRACKLIIRKSFNGLGLTLKINANNQYYIAKVERNSPAELSGLKWNDILVKVNDSFLLGSMNYLDVYSLLKSSMRNKNIIFEVIREDD